MAEDSRIPVSSNTDATNPSDSGNSLVTAKVGDPSTLESSLLSLSLKQSQVDFILKNREQCLKNPRILSIKFEISESKASEVIEILKSAKSDTETELSPAVMEKIKACLVKYPDMNHEEVALLCELDEQLISKYFEMLPLNKDQKSFIKERYNKDNSISDISNLLEIGINRVREYVEATFVTFSGEEGMKVLDIIHKHFSPIPIPSLREKIRSKNLKLQDQLCCKLPRKNREDFEFLMQYFRKYDESDNFLKCDLNLSMDDITKIKQSSRDDVEQLSSKLNKVESIIYDYINQYAVYHIENANCAELQAKQISEIALSFGTTKFSFDNYRTIITNSFDEIISQVENATECKGDMALIRLLPLVFYYLKCSLPFEDIARIIANLSDITLTTHDVFHLVFQLPTDAVLRGFCIEHYSFSNAVPLYYPKLSVGNSATTKFEVCKELWYCLERYQGLISFGLGRASWNAIGKSSLLDMIFETDFVKGSPQGSAFHFRSIDIQLTKNLYGEFDRSDLEHWAYIDCHGYSDSKVIHFMCSRLDLALIHVSYHDYDNNQSALNKELSLFEGKLKHIYLLIRDSECVEVSVSSERTGDRSKTIVFIPDLTRKNVKLHSIVKSLKEIGYEILHLEIEQPKQIQSEFIEGILLDLDIEIVHEIRKENQLIQQITRHIEKTAGDKIDFNFLNFYPHYVEYMGLYHKASYETDQSVIDKLNIDCARLEAKMKHTPLGEVVVYFNLILQRENSSLVL